MTAKELGKLLAAINIEDEVVDYALKEFRRRLMRLLLDGEINVRADLGELLCPRVEGIAKVKKRTDYNLHACKEAIDNGRNLIMAPY